MKILSVIDRPDYKTVDYFGISYTVDLEVDFIAIDEDGLIYGYEIEPEIDGDSWYSAFNPTYLGKVEYEGDWKESLLRV